MITNEQHKNIIKTLEPYKPSKIGIFGSYARSMSKENSDIDILINTKKDINLLDFVRLEKELSDILGIEVDLVTENSLNKHLKPYIQNDIIYILNDEECCCLFIKYT